MQIGDKSHFLMFLQLLKRGTMLDVAPIRIVVRELT